MNRILQLVFAAILLHTVTLSQEKVLLTGTVLGFDGKPTPMAHVHLQSIPLSDGELTKRYTLQVNMDGSFSMKVPPGFYKAQFSGVNHQETQYDYMVIDEREENRFAVRLALNHFRTEKEVKDSLMISLPWEQSVAMNKKGKGKYIAEVTIPEFFADIGLLSYHISGIVIARRVNGTMSDYYQYDGGGDYLSKVKITSNPMTIEFDYNKLPHVSRTLEKTAFKSSVSGTVFDRPLAALAKEIERIGKLHLPRLYRGTYGGPSAKSVVFSDKIPKPAYPRSPVSKLVDTVRYSPPYIFYTEATLKPYSAQWKLDSALVVNAFLDNLEMLNRLKTQMSSDSLSSQERISTAFKYIELVARAYSPDDYMVDRELLKKAFEIVTPSHPLWSVSYAYMLTSRSGDQYEYQLRVMREHPSQELVLRIGERMKDTADRDSIRGDSINVLVLKTLRDRVTHPTLQEHIESVTNEAEYYRKQWRKYRRMMELREMLGVSQLTDSLKRASTEKDRLPINFTGRKLPAFTLKDMDQSDKVISNSTLRGKYALIDFWGISCGPCVENIPMLEELHERFKERLQLVSIAAFSPNIQSIRRFRSKVFPMPWLNVYADRDEEKTILEALDVKFLPRIFLIDPEGVVLAQDEAVDMRMIEKILGMGEHRK